MRLWLSNYVEHEGLARLTITILLITTVSCLSYTWGYYEGVHNQIYAASIDGLRSNGSMQGISAHAAAQLLQNSSRDAAASDLSAASAAEARLGADPQGAIIQASRQRHRKHQRPRTRAKMVREDDAVQQSSGLQALIQSAGEQVEQQRPVQESQADEVAAQAADVAGNRDAADGTAADGTAADGTEDLGPALPGPDDDDDADGGAVGAGQPDMEPGKTGS